MRLSKLFLKTYYEDPADAEVASHKLLARAGYLVKTGSGIYTLTPLMWRVVRKVMQVVCEEMDRAGAQEVMMPILQPFELWEESKRLEGYLNAKILFNLEDRKGAKLALGPTHEEVITDVVRRTLSSHKELPVTLYQQQMKFRDEIRPRFGLMRGREFMMKDAYSFDADTEGQDASYEAMREAYHRIFKRLGLRYVVVDADSGAIGGSGSQEFMVTADAGEDDLLLCEAAGYGANVEKADSVIPKAPEGGEPKPLRREPTPGIKTVDQLCAFFSREAASMVKTVLYKATSKDDVQHVAVLMRGDRQINEVKLLNVLDVLAVELCDDATVRRLTGAEPGFAGPIGLAKEVRILADRSVEGMTNVLCGCCEAEVHALDVNFGRDCPMPEFHDLRLAQAGDGCILDPSQVLTTVRGIEVGHIFKLGTKYSEAMNCRFIGKDGKQHPMVMGCYGIGTTRVAQSSVEQNYDDKGIVWPWAMAPYHLVITWAGKKDTDGIAGAEKLYEELRNEGYEVLLDDRDLGLGARLKDAELIGIPFRILFGRGFKEGKVEINCRRTGETTDLTLDDVRGWIESRKES
ncbi:MAG: proline--tRNA ligase [Planctomycetes bacterium]|nr:proline--tRNA ligase [Planctomycetota bacterium]